MHTNSGKRVFHVIMRRHCTSGRSSHSSLPEAVRFHECGTLRYGQAPSGALRHSLKRSASISIQPSTSVSSTTTVAIATTVSRATDTLHCFNGLQQPQRPHRPKEPEEPQRPQGWMLSFNSPHPPTFRKEPKEYKPNQRNFHRKQDFPQNCGKPSTEMSLFFFCGSSHSCLPSNIAHHPHQAHQHYKTLTKQCVSVRDVREVGAVRLVREEEE